MRHTGRRTVYPRAALLVIALLSAVMLGGVLDAACKAHGLGTMPSRSADAGVVAVALADDAMPGMSHGGGEHSSDGEECDCTCIGACTMAAPLAVPPSGTTLRIAVVGAEPRHALDVAPEQPILREPDRLLPFATGPPRRLPALS